MNFIDGIKEKAKKLKKTIILPESMDERVLKAAEIIIKEGIANIILIGDENEIKTKNYLLSDVTIINPKTYKDTEKYIQKLVNLRKHKRLTYEEAKKYLLEDYMYFACMLVLDEKADGIVSGACHSTSNTLKPALQIIKTKESSKLVSTFFIMDIPNCSYGDNGIFLFADCGLNRNPNSEELAYIAVDSADSFKNLIEKEPVVAMLSYSTKGSAKHEDVDKVINATNLAKKMSNYFIDGELQLDAAIVPEVANLKDPKSEVAGKANVLIFPNLDAGNIGYKLVQRLANAKAYGPITQGIKKPINDLSRGCSVQDIVGVVAITALQAK